MLGLDGVLESMRGKRIIYFVLLAAGVIGCKTSVSEIGSNIFTTNLFNIALVDTASVKISTVLNDSMITSGTGRLLVGYHEDEKLGAVSVKSIFQVGPATAVQLDKEKTEYLGLRLYLKRDGYSYYDTTSTQTISVYQLKKVIKSATGNFYNTAKFEIDTSAPALGTLTFLPRPHHKDSLEVVLPDALGQQLMTLAQEGDLQLSTSTDFIRFFKGLVLVADSTSSRNMIGFTAKPELRLYYRDLSALPTKDRWVTFGTGLNPYFNYFYSNRTSTPLSPIVKYHDKVRSEDSDNEAYFQSGVGLALRLEMPHLRDFLFNDRNFRCSRAIIEMVPVRSSIRPDPLPPVLSLYRVDGLNRLLSNVPLGGRLLIDGESGRNTHYEADVTSFVNTQIQTDAFNNNGLLILLDDKQYRSSVNRLYVGDRKNQYKLRLRLYYITLSNQ